jgi:hypothetical protein
MCPDAPTTQVVVDESAWVYLAAHHRDDEVHASQSFAALLTAACERSGFAVYPTASADALEQAAPPHWIDALRHAEVCVIDLGVASAVAGAELAMAYCSGRPVVTLRAEHELLPAALASLTQHHPAVREVVFSDAQDCVAQLSAVLGDPSWQAVVRSATLADSH